MTTEIPFLFNQALSKTTKSVFQERPENIVYKTQIFVTNLLTSSSKGHAPAISKTSPQVFCQNNPKHYHHNFSLRIITAQILYGNLFVCGVLSLSYLGTPHIVAAKQLNI